MAAKHILARCKAIPVKTREKLIKLKAIAKSSDGGGRRYWSEALRLLGVEETESEGLVLMTSKTRFFQINR
jgi:hypothetical protein